MTKQQQIAVLVLLLLIGSGIWAWQYWPSAGAGIANSSAAARDYQRLNFPDSRLDWQAVDRRHKAEYKPSGVNLFSTIVPPSAAEIKQNQENQKKAQEAAQAAATQQQQQQSQVVDLPGVKFFGYGNVPNGSRRLAFLSYQDEVFIVSEGDTLMGRYRIVKINNASIEFEEIASGRRGQKNLEDQGPNA